MYIYELTRAARAQQAENLSPTTKTTRRGRLYTDSYTQVYKHPHVQM